jgi:hypothetical protein
MSAETEFRALLAANAALTALVSTRIAQNAVPQGASFPLIVFTASHKPSYGLDDTLLDDEVTFQVQCWASTAVQADAVADAAETALGTSGTVTERASTYDPDLGADCTALTIQWWA